MKSLLITKTGGVFYTRQYASKNSSSGEQGETEGMFRHIHETFPDVPLVFFGHAYGLEEYPYITHIKPEIKGLTELSPSSLQESLWAQDLEALCEYDFAAALCVAGYSPTWSTINNARGAIIQLNSVKYSAPILNVIQRLGLPRIVINNDPRTYPKDQEMSYGWAHCRPAALLDQISEQVHQVVGGRRYLRRSVYAAAESWGYHITLPECEREYSCTAIAHAHIDDGCKQRRRYGAWHTVLAGDRPDDFRIFGKGWTDKTVGYAGVLKPNEVSVELRRSFSCPMVGLMPGFYSSKIFVAMAQDCLPICYGGKEDPYAYDPFGKYVPLDSPYRIKVPGDLRTIVMMLQREHSEYRRMLKANVKPDFAVLDDCVIDLLDGRDVTTDSWFQDYGGYRLCT